jgi:acylphosphatase
MAKHLNIHVYGRVQGMGYRASARDRAAKLGLTGFVRNEPDGSVYLEVEGEAEALQKFQQWCKRGPLFARVKNLEAVEESPKGYTSFSIR